MAVPTQPSFIPSAWAESGQYNNIPATQANPGDGSASWSTGFPLENTLPVSQGGVPSQYKDFQGVLHSLSQFAQFQQAGGIFAWSVDIDYPVGAVVLGTDDNLYMAVQQSGPSLAAGAKDPTTQTAYWEMIVSGGNQTIRGAKTFTSSMTLKVVNPYIYMQETDFIRNTGQTGYSAIIFQDNSDSPLTKHQIVSNCSSNGFSYIRLQAYSNTQTEGSQNNTAAVDVYIGTNGGAQRLQPSTDNELSLGVTNNRWTQLYAATSTIATSDERQKSNIQPFSDEVLDAWGDVDWYGFQFRDSVADKGENARIHVGVIAQRVQSVFAAHGLDAGRYGLFCYDSWEALEEEWKDIEIKDDDGNVIRTERVCVQEAREAGDRYSIRYEEALAMEAAYQRRRADRLEAKVSGLEERLARLESLLESDSK